MAHRAAVPCLVSQQIAILSIVSTHDTYLLSVIANIGCSAALSVVCCRCYDLLRASPPTTGGKLASAWESQDKGFLTETELSKVKTNSDYCEMQCPVILREQTGTINLRISAGSRGLLSDTLVSRNKNNDLTRCNCYCNNSWTCRILITGDSEPWRHYSVKSPESRPVSWDMAGTCLGPGPCSQWWTGPGSPRTRQISNVWGEERGGCGGAAETVGWGFPLPRPGDHGDSMLPL